MFLETTHANDDHEFDEKAQCKQPTTFTFQNMKQAIHHYVKFTTIWAVSSEFGSYRLCVQRRLRRACPSAQSCQDLRCLLIQAASQEESSDRKLGPWPFWMAGHAQLKLVMTECWKTQIHLTGLIFLFIHNHFHTSLCPIVKLNISSILPHH